MLEEGSERVDALTTRFLAEDKRRVVCDAARDRLHPLQHVARRRLLCLFVCVHVLMS